MPTHDTALESVRVEVAFSADPGTASPAWVDLTQRVDMARGIDIVRGRRDQFDAVQVGQCSLTFDNTDGYLTPGNASSPFYPNVKPGNRLRVSTVVTEGNLLDAEDVSFEGGTVGGWVGTGATLTNSSTRAWDGTKSLKVVWASGVFKNATLSNVAVTPGVTYTLSAYVWVPAGSSPVYLVAGSPGFPEGGASTTTTNAWERISVTWTAVATIANLSVTRLTGAAAEEVHADGFMVEVGSSPGTFIASPPVVTYRYDGYVDQWPVTWPTGGQELSAVSVSAYDLQSRIARTRPLGSVVAETLRVQGAAWHLPLDEESGSTSAGDRIAGAGSISVAQIGAGGGELSFASGTGPGTDGTSAPMFTPVSVTEGFYLYGRVYAGSSADYTLRASFNTSADSVAQTITRWTDPWGVGYSLETSATGRLVLKHVNMWNASVERTITSANIYADGRTHNASATLSWAAGVVTLVLTVDGVEVGTDSHPKGGALDTDLSRLSVGGDSGGRLFTGTISHVAAFLTALTLGDLAEQRESASTGFSGETSDERIDRIASWIGIDPALLDLDVGLSTIGHVDSTGKSAWAYMQEVADTEAGILFVATDGRLRFHNRARANYEVDATVDVSVDAAVIDPGVRVVLDLDNIANDVSVSRTGGATFRVTDAASIAAYGLFGDSLTTLADTDGEALSRANWTLNQRANPEARLPELTLDGLSEPTSAESVRGIDIGSRVQVTGMPSQAPRSTEDLRVQGYSERIGAGGWTVTANTTPYLTITPLIVDDAAYGLLDSGNVLAY